MFHRIHSRRGFPDSTEMKMVLLHPSHVHVPTPPPLNIPDSPPSFPPKPRSRPRPSHLESNVNGSGVLLKDAVVQPLIDRGLICGTATEGHSRWRGVVMVPRSRETKQARLTRAEQKKGTFCRLELQYVEFSPQLLHRVSFALSSAANLLC